MHSGLCTAVDVCHDEARRVGARQRDHLHRTRGGLDGGRVQHGASSRARARARVRVRVRQGLRACGLVSPSIIRPTLTAFVPSHTMHVTGPDSMYSRSDGKKGFSTRSL